MRTGDFRTYPIDVCCISNCYCSRCQNSCRLISCTCPCFDQTNSPGMDGQLAGLGIKSGEMGGDGSGNECHVGFSFKAATGDTNPDENGKPEAKVCTTGAKDFVVID